MAEERERPHDRDEDRGKDDEEAEKARLKRVSLCIGAPPQDYEVANAADVTAVIYSLGRRPEQSGRPGLASTALALPEKAAHSPAGRCSP